MQCKDSDISIVNHQRQQCPTSYTTCVRSWLLHTSLRSSPFLSFFRRRRDWTSKRKAGERRSTPGAATLLQFSSCSRAFGKGKETAATQASCTPVSIFFGTSLWSHRMIKKIHSSTFYKDLINTSQLIFSITTDKAVALLIAIFCVYQ